MPKSEGRPDEEGDGAGKKAGRRKKLIIGGAAALVLIAAGGGSYVLLGRSNDENAPVAEARKSVSFVEIREMTINLAPEPNDDRPRLLKFRVALEVKDTNITRDIQPLLPRVEDTFQVFVRELRASDLEGSAGIYRLREELVRRVNIAVYPAKVDAVLFKDIVVQ